jgi:hypothetical protein
MPDGIVSPGAKSQAMMKNAGTQRKRITLLRHTL